MPTDFPAAVDSYDDPAGNVPMNHGSRTHSERHKDLNDAIKAIETFLLNPSTGSGLPRNILTKTADYTAAPGDLVLVDATAGAVTITLPPDPADGALVAVKKIDATTNAVIVIATGAGSIDGDATASTITQRAGAVLEHVGADAWIIAASMSTTGPAGVDGVDGIDAILSTIEDEGVALTQRSTLNFTGAGVTASDAGGKTVVNIPGGGAVVAGLLPRKLVSGRYVTMPGVIGNLGLDTGYEFAFPIEIFETTTFTKIGINVAALDVGATIRLGLRQNNAGVPGTLVAEGASTIDASSATGTIGDKEVNFAQTIVAGVYWLVARNNGGTPQVKGMSNVPVQISTTTTAGAMQNNCSGYNNGGGGAGVLPAAWGATSAHQVTVPRVVLKTA